MELPGSRAALRAWLRWRTTALEDVPRPEDRPFATVRGTDPIECLVVGSGPLTSWGVGSHQLGLLGALARALARRTHRGVSARGLVRRERATELLGRIDEIAWGQADVVVLVVGAQDALLAEPPASWAVDLARLLDAVLQRVQSDAPVFVVGIPPADAVPILDGLGSAAVDGLIAAYNEQSRAVCEARPRTHFVPIGSPGAGRAGEYRTPEQYSHWGESIVDGMLRPDSDLRSAALHRARSALTEQERASAVERLGILDTPPEERFDRLVALARRVFQTPAAVFSVVHGRRDWFKAKVGVPFEEVLRDESLCDVAVRQDGPLIVGDALADPRFAGNPYVHDLGLVRFYAGHPVRAPDGQPIGALCVFDSEPRDAIDVDVATLRDLAVMVEAELGGRTATGA